MPIALPAALLELGAETIALRASYEAAPGCPDRAAFYEALSARSNRVRQANGDEPALEISVRVSRSERGFHGELRPSQAPSGARSVDGETCQEVVEALSLTLAMSLDPDAHAPSPPPAIPPASPPTALQESAPVAPAPAPSLLLESSLSVLSTWLDGSGPSTGGALSLAALRESNGQARGSLRLSLLFAHSGFPDPPSDHRTRFAALALDACPLRLHHGPLELAPCALAIGGLLELTGRNVTPSETVTRAWWSVGLEAQAAWHLGARFLVQASLAGTTPLIEHRYFTSNPEHVIAETPALSALFRAGFGYRF